MRQERDRRRVGSHQEPGYRIAALLSGKLDVVQPVPVQDVPRLKASDQLKVLLAPEIRTIYTALLPIWEAGVIRYAAERCDTKLRPTRVRARGAG